MSEKVKVTDKSLEERLFILQGMLDGLKKEATGDKRQRFRDKETLFKAVRPLLQELGVRMGQYVQFSHSGQQIVMKKGIDRKTGDEKETPVTYYFGTVEVFMDFTCFETGEKLQVKSSYPYSNTMAFLNQNETQNAGGNETYYTRRQMDNYFLISEDKDTDASIPNDPNLSLIHI